MSKDRDWCLPDRFWAGAGASCTFKARPKEPRNEELSLTTKAPGSSFLSSSIAGTILESETIPAPRAQPPTPGPEGHQTADVTGSPFVPRKSLLLSNLHHCCCMRSAGHCPSLDLPLAIPSSAPTQGPDLIPEPRPLKHCVPLPCSRVMLGLNQYLEVSITNFMVGCMSLAGPGDGQRRGTL